MKTIDSVNYASVHESYILPIDESEIQKSDSKTYESFSIAAEDNFKPKHLRKAINKHNKTA